VLSHSVAIHPTTFAGKVDVVEQEVNAIPSVGHFTFAFESGKQKTQFYSKNE